MKNIINKIGKFGAGAVLGLAMLGNTACSRIDYLNGKETERILNDYHTSCTISIERMDTYWGIARDLQKNCPETFGRLDVRDIYQKLKEFNDNKELFAGKKAKVPGYNEKCWGK